MTTHLTVSDMLWAHDLAGAMDRLHTLVRVAPETPVDVDAVRTRYEATRAFPEGSCAACTVPDPRGLHLMRIYFDFNDWWVGYYRGPNHHYVCPLPTVVISWSRTS